MSGEKSRLLLLLSLGQGLTVIFSGRQRTYFWMFWIKLKLGPGWEISPDNWNCPICDIPPPWESLQLTGTSFCDSMHDLRWCQGITLCKAPFTYFPANSFKLYKTCIPFERGGREKYWDWFPNPLLFLPPSFSPRAADERAPFLAVSHSPKR